MIDYEKADAMDMAADVREAMEEEIAALRAERDAALDKISRMRPVVEAASRWRFHRHYTFSRERLGDALEQALEAYNP